MINKKEMQWALHDAVNNLKFDRSTFEDGYWKMTIHIQLNNTKSEYDVKKATFNRYLGLVGSKDNKFGDPFKIASKKQARKEFFELIGQATALAAFAFAAFSFLIMTWRNIWPS